MTGNLATYSGVGLFCLFLEQKACSIHRHRPLSCREYLVVSAPEECTRPGSGRVEKVDIPRNLSTTLYTFGDGSGSDKARVVPLALLLEWGETHPQDRFQSFQPASYLENYLRKLAD